MYQYGKDKFSLGHSLDLKGLIVYSNNAQSVIYCNFHPFTHTADDSHCLIFAITRKKISTDYLHPKKKKIINSHKVPSMFLLTYPLACN